MVLFVLALFLVFGFGFGFLFRSCDTPSLFSLSSCIMTMKFTSIKLKHYSESSPSFIHSQMGSASKAQ